MNPLVVTRKLSREVSEISTRCEMLRDHVFLHSLKVSNQCIECDKKEKPRTQEDGEGGPPLHVIETEGSKTLRERI